MALTRCRGCIAGLRRGLELKSQETPLYLRHISLSSSVSKASKGKSKQTISFDELPRAKVDSAGKAATPLAPYKEYEKEHHAPSPDALLDEEQLYRQAVKTGDIPDTALAKQVYLNWKRFPDCIVLTRVGKFYEVSDSSLQSYFAPAIRLASLLNLKLANRKYSGGTWPFSGFPVPQLDKYLKILVQDLGNTVVLVEEVDEGSEGSENASPADLKPRRVGRVVTPGTLVDESWLNGSESRYLLALAIGEEVASDTGGKKLPISLAYTDASTGEFFSKDTELEEMEDELARVAPREVVLDASLKEIWDDETRSRSQDGGLDRLVDLLRVLGVHVSFADPSQAPVLEGLSPLPSSSNFPTPSITSLDTIAISLLRHHLQYALRDSMPGLSDRPDQQSASSQMQIDAATLAALEIRHAIRPGGLAEVPSYGRESTLLSARGTLLSVLSQTMTAAGHRLLIRTLTSPSTDIEFIEKRLSLVQSCVDRRDLRDDLRELLKDVGDIMRVIQRFRGRRGDGRDIWETARWIRAVGRLISSIQDELAVQPHGAPGPNDGSIAEGRERLVSYLDQFCSLGSVAEKIEHSVDETNLFRGLESEGDEQDLEGVEAAGEALVATLGKKKEGESGREAKEREREEKEQALWWIKPGFSTEIQTLHDEMAELRRNKEKLQDQLRRRYDTQSLILTKGFRNGYHVLLNKKSDFAKLDKTKRFQVLSEGRSAKAYALMPWSIMGAKMETLTEKMMLAQKRAFLELRQMVVDISGDVQRNAGLVDELDLALSFAQTAVDSNYVRPRLTSSTNLRIVNGRHPSVESALLNSARAFTPNTTEMTPSSHLHLITGPNQGGKSTLLRQTAVICILAQCGSFVPADEAEIGIVDRVFSRIGARDDLFRDRSTFMLEMVETSAILRHATNRSLVIMDEIGRGTTLHAGMSIAYATLDHLLGETQCRTLFATHYHELADMLTSPDGAVRQGVGFFCTDVEEGDGAFSYQYKLKPGVNYTSHAIKAAKLAGMPESFLRTAQETLDTLQLKDPSA